jgi:hypothetical protein
VGSHPATICGRVSEYDPGGGILDVPAAFSRHLRRQPAVPVHGGEQLLDVNELGLELDHEEFASQRVERKDIDDSSFSIDCERNLRHGQPSGVSTEEAGDLLMHAAVAGAEHSIEVASTPARDKVDPDLESSRHGKNRVERQFARMAAFNPRDRRGRRRHPLAYISLPHAAADANRAEDTSEADQLHPGSMAKSCYQPLIGRL